MQVIPAVEASVVPVVENDAHCIISDALEGCDLDVFLACDEHLLVRRMALHLRARRLDAQIFGRKPKSLAVIIGDRQYGFRLVDAELDRPWLRGATHVTPRRALRRRVGGLPRAT